MKKLNMFFFDDEVVAPGDALIFYGTIVIMFLCTVSMIAGVIHF